jgi:hypothetical protein
MMEVSKIQFSEPERELMQNAAIILTKNSVLEKIKSLLELVQTDQVEWIRKEGHDAIEAFVTSPKISRGEYYQGLPYLILDYPRRSGSNELFFIRNMFWWGNFFSTTLHLSGRYKELYLQKVIESYKDLQDYSIGIHEDPWMHHFEKDNYIAVNTLSEKAFTTICENGLHLKLAKAMPLDQWQQAREQLMENWKMLLKVCGLITNTV